MSSPSGVADATLPTSGASNAERNRIAALAAADDGDNGEPVLDVPPLIEPTADPFSQRPLRRSFLAPVTPPPAPPETPSPAPPAPSVPAAAPKLVESAILAPATVPEPAVEVAPAARPEPAPVVEARTAVIPEPAAAATPETAATPAARVRARWLTPPRRLWPTGRLTQAFAISGMVVVIAVLLLDFLHLGPFAPVRHYPTADAPKDPAARVAYFQRGADAGDPNAEMELAILYAKGEGVAQNYATAATWFRASANRGVARAQFDLGVMYERGRGVPVDLTQAAEWYLKAAQGGFPLAQYNLAVCYTKGQGLRKDLSEAALWYHRAAAQGVVQAMINLAVMYDKGNGVAASPVDAYAWYQAAGRRGDQDSAHRASDLYNGMAKLDQVRAEALAGDVAGSIHDSAPAGGDAALGAPNSTEH